MHQTSLRFPRQSLITRCGRLFSHRHLSDAQQAIQKFEDKESLNFPLLSDADHTVAEAYGAWGEKKNYGKTYVGLIRSTIVLDEEGKVTLAQYNVRATGHVAKLRRDLGIDS